MDFNKRGRLTKITLIISFFVVLFSASFILGGKIYERYSVVVSAANVDSSKTLKSNKVLSNVKVSKPAPEDPGSVNKPSVEDDREQQVPKVEIQKQISDFNPYASDGKKVAYLTFDDGPSPNITPKILDILKNENVKATFFIIGKMALGDSELVKREKAEGHQIANHTFSHDYKYLYSNTDNFIGDVKKCESILKDILGDYDNSLIRFPGGSFGSSLEVYKQAITNAGYHYVDWNALNGDAEAINIPPDKLLSRLKETVQNKQHVVILMHDAPSKETTVEALKGIIDYLKSQGYEFRTLQ